MPSSHSDRTRSASRGYVDANRPSAAVRGYGRTHQKWRLLVLHRDPVCRHCNRAESTDADHVKPLEAGGLSTLENGQGLCHKCHSIKTQKEVSARYPLA